ncbi:MAG: tetratricopeptide repeat protein [Pyrinomonadaceae bacterium]|nr:tetratricopeptide repeat protein [Pyrinomonadaceae bacterium]
MKERIQIATTNSVRNGRTTGAEKEQLNFYLQPRDRRKTLPPNEIVFAQNLPQKDRDRFEQGVDHLKKGAKDDAAKNFEEALDEFSDYFLAAVELGRLYFERKKFERSALTYEQAVRINSGSFTANWGIALALRELNQNKRALTALNKALTIDSNSVEALLLQGVIHCEMYNNNSELQSMLTAK